MANGVRVWCVLTRFLHSNTSNNNNYGAMCLIFLVHLSTSFSYWWYMKLYIKSVRMICWRIIGQLIFFSFYSFVLLSTYLLIFAGALIYCCTQFLKIFFFFISEMLWVTDDEWNSGSYSQHHHWIIFSHHIRWDTFDSIVEINE